MTLKLPVANVKPAFCLSCVFGVSLSKISLSFFTFAVLKTAVLQSGRMLTDQAGNWYDVFRNTTVLSFLSSEFDRNAEQLPNESV